MKLSSLCRLDGVKLNEELEEKRRFIADCRYILMTPTALDEKLIETLDLVAKKFGDARKTKITNVLGDEEEPEALHGPRDDHYGEKLHELGVWCD